MIDHEVSGGELSVNVTELDFEWRTDHGPKAILGINFSDESNFILNLDVLECFGNKFCSAGCLQGLLDHIFPGSGNFQFFGSAQDIFAELVDGFSFVPKDDLFVSNGLQLIIVVTLYMHRIFVGRIDTGVYIQNIVMISFLRDVLDFLYSDVVNASSIAFA